jgi:alkylation response protein AidB-like acyl-CoA dehydrogenase
MKKNGLFGIKAPKELGGQGGDTLAYVIVIEEFSRVSMVSAVYVSGANSLGSGPLMLAGTREQLEKYLAPVARERNIPASALPSPERARTRAALPQRRCVTGITIYSTAARLL